MAKGKAKPKQLTPLEALWEILMSSGAGTQEQLREELEKLGLEVTQSTISRCLRRLGAIKAVNAEGEAVYQLPGESPPPTAESTLNELVTEIAANETMIVIHTLPGSAPLIARQLDHYVKDILGTIAGDDCIFVAPAKGANIHKLVETIRASFMRS